MTLALTQLLTNSWTPQGLALLRSWQQRFFEKKLTDPSMFLLNLEDDEDNGIEGDHAETVTASSDVAVQGDATVTFKWQQNGVKLLQAAEEGNLSFVFALLSVDRYLICVRDSDLYTPLHRASYNNHANVVKALLEHGADVGARTDEGWTPLHLAARWAALDAAKTLSNDGAADINAVTHGHLTPLHVAVSSGEDNAAETVRLLLSYQHVRWDAKTDVKQTALDLAKQVSTEMVQLFDRFSKSYWWKKDNASSNSRKLTATVRCFQLPRSESQSPKATPLWHGNIFVFGNNDDIVRTGYAAFFAHSLTFLMTTLDIYSCACGACKDLREHDEQLKNNIRVDEDDFVPQRFDEFGNVVEASPRNQINDACFNEAFNSVLGPPSADVRALLSKSHVLEI